MNPPYVSLTFDMHGLDKDIWIALLCEWPFEAFHEEQDSVIAYIQSSDVSSDVIEWIISQQGIHFHNFRQENVPQQNWNAVWESSFQPVAVNAYCYIRAEFHPPAPTGFTHTICISPKMAFGTGHHATTWMMIEAMSHLDFKGKDVLDYGCGTGILSILAAKEGAKTVTGIDIQPEAIENSFEHATLNQVESKCQFLFGDLSVVPVRTYDIILANINTHVIDGSIDVVKQMLRPEGYILLSGMMTDDQEFIREHIDFSPCIETSRQKREDWLQITLHRNH